MTQAQQAFDEANYPRAIELAQAAAHPPDEGAALYLIGLAQFRAGQAEEALATLDRAGAAADKPDALMWHYNRAACLYELGRFLEAEAEYLDVSLLDPSLRAVALVNAGWAALDAGSPERARWWARQANDAATGHANDLVAELLARLDDGDEARATEEYSEGVQAFDAGRYGEAFARFNRAASFDPRDGRIHIMTGASALELGRSSEAQAELLRALSMPLAEPDQRAARDYLELVRRRQGPDLFSLSVRAGTGYDSNTLQTTIGSGTGDDRGSGEERPDLATSQTPSATANLGATATLRPRWLDNWLTEVNYSVDQWSYVAQAAQDRSLQLHELSLSLENRPSPRWRLGVSGLGQLMFTGLSNFRGMQVVGGVSAWALADETDSTSLRLDLGWQHKQALTAEFDYLSGERFDLGVAQELRLPRVTLSAGVRLRAELIGSTTSVIADVQRQGGCDRDCQLQIVTPYDFLAPAAWVGARVPLPQRFVLDLSLGGEWRTYLTDNQTSVYGESGVQGSLGQITRHDGRYQGGAALTWRPRDALSVTLGYDFLF
ncbi:MAG: hypothetical protein JST92_14820, partial [Deltaproteobacteria bacterium]|nr:hypothetical protein [Deltaproteobacteria bacterium]